MNARDRKILNLGFNAGWDAHEAFVSCEPDDPPQGEVVRTPVVPDATTEAPAATPRPAGSDIDSIFEATYNCDSCCQDVVGWDVADFVDFQHVLCSRCVVAQGVAQALDKVNDRVEAAQDAQRGSSLTAVLTATVNAYSVACRDAIAEALDAMEPQTSASTTAAEPQVAPAETQGLRTPVDDATATTQPGGADRVTRPPASGPLELWAVLSYKDGDEQGWHEEFAYLREHHADRLAALREDVLANGIREPILIGNDGRIWDGHHRLCVAEELNLRTVPVKFGTSS